MIESRPHLLLLLPVTIWCLGTPARGQENEPVAEDELAQLLDAMAEAGMEPTAAAQEQWEGGADPQSSPWSGNVSGTMRWRGQFQAGQPHRQDLRLDFSGGPARVRLRLKRDHSTPGLVGGGIELAAGKHRLAAGLLGLQTGFGLLAAGPGRGGTLAADGNMARARTKLSVWNAAPEARSLQGVGGEVGAGRWALAGVMGTEPASGESLTALSLRLDLNRSRHALNATLSSGGRGLGIWSARRAGVLGWSAEAVAWSARQGGSPHLVWQAIVDVRPARRIALQAGLARNGGGPRPPAGERPVLLRGNRGSGWALRGQWRARQGLQVALLHHRAVDQEALPRQERTEHSAWDLLGRLRWDGSWSLVLRTRWSRTWVWSWSEQFPWQPPHREEDRSRWLGSGDLVREVGRQRLKVGWRLLSRGDGGEHQGRRILASLQYQGPFASHWEFRGGYGTAWGDPLDLVSALAPGPGLVLPRHWGAWRSETHLGVGFFSSRHRGWVAVSRRRPGDPAGQEGWQAWLEIKLAW
jgi:hypothetical protein